MSTKRILYPQAQFSLEFRCDYITSSKRHFCEQFWELIQKHPQLETIMAKGWYDIPDELEERKYFQEKTQLPCDNLTQLIEIHPDIVARRMNKDEGKCLMEEKMNSVQSVAQLLEDLKEFDSRVVPLQSIPPKLSDKASKFL